MARKRFLSDVDGVLIDFSGPALSVAERFSGAPPPADVMQEWDLFRSYNKPLQDLFFTEFKRKHWCRNLPVYPGAQIGIERVRCYADVFFVTAPLNGEYWAHERSWSLVNNFGAKFGEVIHTHAKYVCAGDVFLDDKPEHVETWCQHHPNGIGLLWDQPYNRRHTHLRRAYNWDDVLKAVRE